MPNLIKKSWTVSTPSVCLACCQIFSQSKGQGDSEKETQGQGLRSLEKWTDSAWRKLYSWFLSKIQYCDVSNSKTSTGQFSFWRLWKIRFLTENTIKYDVIFSVILSTVCIDGFSRRCNCDMNRWVGFYLSGKSCFTISYKVKFISNLLNDL